MLFFLRVEDMLFWDVRSKFYWMLEGFAPYRNLVEDIIQKLELKPNQYILDAGCGVGIFENLITEKDIPGLKIVAVDFSKKMLEQARKNLRNSQNSLVDFSQVDLNKTLPYKNGIFDAVFSNNVIYALTDPARVVKEFYRILREGGRVVLSTPKADFSGKKLLFNELNCKSGWQKVKSLIMLPLVMLLTLPFELVISYWEGKGRYHRFTKGRLSRILTTPGFRNINIGYSYANQNFLAVAYK